MTAVHELEEAAARARDTAGSAVVSIGRHRRRGAGIVIAPGRVLTNAHNLRGDEVGVVFGDGHTEIGSVEGIDVDGDLATIAVDTADADPVEWGEPAAPGAPVFVLGPTIDGGIRVTLGTISATGRSFRGPRGRLIRDGVEHTAPVARGSSGSPVVDASGRLVGINTHRLGDSFYLAIPATADLRARLEDLSRGVARDRPRLGIAVAPPRVARKLRRSVGLPERDGLLVRGVEAGGPADRAGIREGDLIVAASGVDTANIDALHDILDARDASETLELRIVRGSDEIDVAVGFGSHTPTEEGEV